MAPEMLGEAPPSERTDIFLLGAILFEIAEGKPPHLLDSVAAALDSIQQCAPAFADDSPEELVAIAMRAMARDPAARYSTADELRLAIVAFLEHRSSAEIARESEETLEQLEAQLHAALTEEISGSRSISCSASAGSDFRRRSERGPRTRRRARDSIERSR